MGRKRPVVNVNLRPKPILREDRRAARADGLNQTCYPSRNGSLLGGLTETIRERLPSTIDFHCPDDSGHANAV